MRLEETEEEKIFSSGVSFEALTDTLPVPRPPERTRSSPAGVSPDSCPSVEFLSRCISSPRSPAKLMSFSTSALNVGTRNHIISAMLSNQYKVSHAHLWRNIKIF